MSQITSGPAGLQKHTWGVVAVVLIPVLILIGLAASAAATFNG